jgi:protease I
MLGGKATAEIAIADARADEYDAVVVVGGSGSPEHLWGNARLHEILKATEKRERVIGGICLSGAALARAGVLKGKRATVWKTPQSLAELREGGASYTAEAVTVDGKVVTAEGPHAAKDFGARLVDALAG